jgi:hypothetical protein
VAGLSVFIPIAILGNALGPVLRYPDVGSAILFVPYAALTAVLAVSRPRQWIWYILVDFVAHFATHWPIWPVSWVLMAGAANLTRALVAAGLLSRFFHEPPRLDGIRSLIVFVTSAVFVAPAVGATIGAATVVLHGGSSTYWLPWTACAATRDGVGSVALRSHCGDRGLPPKTTRGRRPAGRHRPGRRRQKLDGLTRARAFARVYRNGSICPSAFDGTNN